jgi:hypothetical protein
MIQNLIQSAGTCTLLFLSGIGAACLVALVCAVFSFVGYVFLGNTFGDEEDDTK